MQSKDPNTRASGALNHPDAAQWMGFLYGEIAPEKKRELTAHLVGCAACANQIQTWRSTMKDLDQWSLPAARPQKREWVPVLKWAAAAAIVLAVGFAFGRSVSPASAELASLKSRVAQLEKTTQQTDQTKTIQAATAAANGEMQRLLTDFARVLEEQRVADQQQVRVAFRARDLRLDNFGTALETVALNTETGFKQTHENITRLVSLSVPANQPTQQ
ncbi:MAG TPA: zf-HC2 domain-containing protein [Candidatus Eisenbacteria bacterium]|nr:zf-HC2 domain-containing protein [Candidatus Eisenbacteria bacterium]